MDGSGWQRKLHVSIGAEQFLDPHCVRLAARRSRICKMGTDRINHRDLLADEEMACAMQHQAALLRVLVLPL
jgi:hypothetical protein